MNFELGIGGGGDGARVDRVGSNVGIEDTTGVDRQLGESSCSGIFLSRGALEKLAAASHNDAIAGVQSQAVQRGVHAVVLNGAEVAHVDIDRAGGERGGKFAGGKRTQVGAGAGVLGEEAGAGAGGGSVSDDVRTDRHVGGAVAAAALGDSGHGQRIAGGHVGRASSCRGGEALDQSAAAAVERFICQAGDGQSGGAAGAAIQGDGAAAVLDEQGADGFGSIGRGHSGASQGKCAALKGEAAAGKAIDHIGGRVVQSQGAATVEGVGCGTAKLNSTVATEKDGATADSERAGGVAQAAGQGQRTRADLGQREIGRSGGGEGASECGAGVVRANRQCGAGTSVGNQTTRAGSVSSQGAEDCTKRIEVDLSSCSHHEGR